MGDGELDGPQGTAVAHGCAPQGPGGKVEERPREAASGLLELGARQPPPRLTLGVQQAHGFRGGGCPAAVEENASRRWDCPRQTNRHDTMPIAR